MGRRELVFKIEAPKNLPQITNIDYRLGKSLRSRQSKILQAVRLLAISS